MKIGLIGSAPASVALAPYSDPSWQLWGCSPGAYFRVARAECWFETHRWEPPTIGKPGEQKPWFSPEYVAWLYKHPCVWGFDLPENMPGAKKIPEIALRRKYGDYFFTSTLAWMFAMAIEVIEQDGKETGNTRGHEIGLWGVDMAATEEYGYQRAGCQFFCQIAQSLGIKIVVPHESDLLTPPILYGRVETQPKHIKLMARKAELEQRLANAKAAKTNAEREEYFLTGAIDDIDYMMKMWSHDGPTHSADFDRIFSSKTENSKPEKEEAPPPSLAIAGADN